VLEVGRVILNAPWFENPERRVKDNAPYPQRLIRCYLSGFDRSERTHQLVPTPAMRAFARWPLTALALVLASTTASATPDVFPLGKVIDSVACKMTSGQSYALYLPTTYTPDKSWPVIFCFDPGARGRTPVDRLHEAAEKYGYIIAGSLNSRNGPLPKNAEAAKAMVNDVGGRFSVDPKRAYTAGLSGGARVAAAFALAGWSKGVIACSAGFPMGEDDIPPRLRFVYFGTTGIEDSNYREMIRLDDALAERSTPHRIVVFDGGHEWAPSSLLQEAVEWLELQSMRTGTRPRDDALIKALLQARIASVPAEPPLDHWRAIKSIAADFSGLADVGSFERQAKELGSSRPVKDALKAEHTLLSREESMIEDLAESATGDSAKRQAALAAQLRQKADAPDDTPERRSVRRAIMAFMGLSRERTRAQDDDDDGNTTAFLEMSALLRPNQPRTLLALARARARDGDKAGALTALEQAAAAGLHTPGQIEGNDDFKKLRNDPRFVAVLAKIRENATQPPSGAEFERRWDSPRAGTGDRE
jgi:hypothetical protein